MALGQYRTQELTLAALRDSGCFFILLLWLLGRMQGYCTHLPLPQELEGNIAQSDSLLVDYYHVQIDKFSLAGYPGTQTIVIEYYIPDGIQTAAHPKPGKPYQGTRRPAYLPYTQEGVQVERV